MTPTTNGQYIITNKAEGKSVEILNQRMDKISYKQFYSNLVEIKDPQGNYYLFGDTKNYMESDFLEVDSEIGSGWMLKDLITNQNDKASFSYVRHTVNNGNKEMHQFSLSEAWYIVGGRKTNTLEYYNETMADHEISLGYSNSWYTTCFINDIVTENERIGFVRDINNEETPYLLKKIVIETKDGTVIKEIKFEQALDWHYLLKKMTVNEKVFSFDYYDKPASSDIYADQWGYYKLIPKTINLDPKKRKIILHKEFENDPIYEYRFNRIDDFAGTHRDKIITLKEFVDKYPNHIQVQVLFLDRNSGETCPNYFALKKITFPTKGTEEYESHLYRDVNSDLKYGGGFV